MKSCKSETEGSSDGEEVEIHVDPVDESGREVGDPESSRKRFG